MPWPTIVPWPKQPELKHCIQVLSNLRTSVSGDYVFLSLHLVFKSRLYCSCSTICPVCHLWYDCRGEQEGEGLPLGTACPQPDVRWLGNHILRRGKSSYTFGLTSGIPLVPDFLFLANKELKALHFTPALHSTPHPSLSLYQQGRIWDLALFLKKMQLHINFTPFSATVSSLNLFLRTYHFIVTHKH